MLDAGNIRKEELSMAFDIYESLKPPEIYNLNSDSNNFSFEENDQSLSQQNLLSKLYNEIKPIVLPSIKREEKESKVAKGPKSFELVLDEAEKINPEVKQYRNFLTKTAKRESGFNSHIQNTTGAPYYGYFQMGKDEIKRTTGLTVEEFRNDPVQQILGAVKLYKMNLKTIKAIGVYNIGKQKGYSDDALVAGAWMGGPGGVKKYLLGLGDPSDSHWYKKAGQKGGSSVGKIMDNWKANE